MIILNIIIDLKVTQEGGPAKGVPDVRAHCGPARA